MENYQMQAKRFKALSDVTRLQIVEMLTEGGLCACKILAHFNITQPTLSYHMKILCGSGIVSFRREGAWMWYSINPQSIAEISVLLENLQKANDKNVEGCACGEGMK